jgi:hypothetical protein
VAGLAVGAAVAPLAHHLLLPLYRRITGGGAHA